MKNHNDDSNDAVDRDLVAYYQSQQVSSERLHAILADAQPPRRASRIALAIAASFLAIFAVAGVHQYTLSSQRTELVLREAALNHTVKLQMDAEAESLAELQRGLGELPFEIKLPDTDLFKKLAMVGGRYCTISGKLAAHVKLADPETAQQYSLFLSPSGNDGPSMDDAQGDVSGVDVRLWQEDGVVYVLAGEKKGVSL